MIKKLTLVALALFAWPFIITAQRITLTNTGNPELDGIFTAADSENGTMTLKFVKTTKEKVYLISPLFNPTENNDFGNVQGWLIHDSQGNEYFAVNTEQNTPLAPPANGWDVGRAGIGLNPNFSLAYTLAEIAPPKTNKPLLAYAFTNPEKANTVVFPNPTTGRVSIFTANPIKKTTLTSLTGKVMLTGTAQNQDISNLPPGTYILTIETGSGSVRQKIIKQ